MAQRFFWRVPSKIMQCVVVVSSLLLTMQQASAILCPSTLPATSLTQCRLAQKKCLASCLTPAQCKGCTQDFELNPGEYLVEVIASAPPSSRGNANPLPSPSPASGTSLQESGTNEAFLQDEGKSKLLRALNSLGIGERQSDATPKPPVEISGFDTTPWVFIVSNLSEESARDLAKRPGIASVSQTVKPQLVVDAGGEVSTTNGVNVTIHPQQIYLENQGTAQVREPNNKSYTAKSDVDIDAMSGWAQYSGMGEGVVIAVIDDGFDVANGNLAGNVAVNINELDCNGIDDDGNGYIDDRFGWNSESKTGCREQLNGESGHGTHVAGLAAASARATNDRLSGAAPFAKFLPVKASQQERIEDGRVISTFGSGSLAEAYRFVLARLKRGENIKVLNLSLAVSCEAVTAVEISLLNQLAAAGVSIVVAAGNAGSNTDSTRFCPASLDIPGLVSVANVTPRGDLHLTSNFGASSITTAAPGTVVYGVNGKLLTGTSMAAPLVSGVVALMYAAQPLLTPTDVRDILLRSAKPVGSARVPVKSGGMVSAPIAVQNAKEWKVFGTVTEAKTELPLRDVLVRLSSPSTGMIGVATDAKGRFALTRPANGEAVNLSVSKNGYVFSGVFSHPNSVPSNSRRDILKFSIVGARREVDDRRRREEH